MGNKLMMKLFVGSESVFFLALILAYVYFWRSAHYDEAAQKMLHIKTTGFFTLLLIASSFTFWKAETYFKEGNQQKLKLWLMVTIGLGIVFLAGQAHEYYGLIQHHLTFSSGEFGSSFYTLTGFHGLHVLSGLIVLGIILTLVFLGYIKKDVSGVVSTVGIYWHFVDAVWLVVFTVVYVLPYLL